MPGLNSQSRGTDRISSELLSFVLCLSLCVLSSLCCSVVILLYCYCVALLLFVLSYVLIVCTVPLPPGVNPIAVDKYINISSDQNSVSNVIDLVLKEEVNIIIGTQIIAKGHNFPKLTLVGVINADLSLENSDLRAAENIY